MPGRQPIPLAERFALYCEPALDGCIHWSGWANERQYGMIRSAGRGRSLRAHRVAFELAYGVVPEGLHVLHRCDTPLCVNPNHLFLGTHLDNMRDKVAKGRQRITPFSYRLTCGRGHAWPVDSVPGNRTCRVCVSDRMRAAYQRQKAERVAL